MVHSSRRIKRPQKGIRNANAVYLVLLRSKRGSFTIPLLQNSKLYHSIFYPTGKGIISQNNGKTGTESLRAG